MLSNITGHLSPKPTNDDKKSSGRSTPSGLMPPRHHAPYSLNKFHPYLAAVKAFKDNIEFEFEASTSKYRQRTNNRAAQELGPVSTALNSLFVGISAVLNEAHAAVVAIAVHDSVYLHDFTVKHLQLNGDPLSTDSIITTCIVNELTSYEHKNFVKIIGAGLPHSLVKVAPTLSSRLWAELDVVPISLHPHQEDQTDSKDESLWEIKSVDEQADSMARKCIMYFGPNLSPILQVGYRGLVEIDAGNQSHMCNLVNYQASCGKPTFDSTMKYVAQLREKRIKIAFFSSTPQGGGVALMRHALVRFARVAGVDLKWYVPKPKPGVFRITKNMHNILQGVAPPGQRISDYDKNCVTEWIQDNANRYWFAEGGPLRKSSEGGADVVIIDDPQIPALIPLIKAATPEKPVLYRSHIQIRSDLVGIAGTPQADIWDFLWDKIQYADMFISHPIPSFVPLGVPREKVAYLPATTDWLDGLNKNLNEWDRGYYNHLYNMECMAIKMTMLNYPKNEYFIQVARFDPSKGVLDVVKSYAEFVRLLKKVKINKPTPQLLIVGNGSVDDPDGTQIYDQTMTYIEKFCPQLLDSISVMRLNPNDQLLNTLISNAHTVLQLSTREGFEVKVSEALHKGRPVIATNVGGIPLQIQDEKTGFLVESGDWKAVAEKLLLLWRDEELYKLMSRQAAQAVSDEVGTVGNALSWFYLANKLAGGGKLQPDGKWVNDLARDEAGAPYKKDENRLPRSSVKAQD